MNKIIVAPKINNTNNITSYAYNSLMDNISNIHAPYTIPESPNMRYISLISFIIFGNSYLLIRLFLSIFKSNRKSYFMSGIKIISKQTLLYFILLSTTTIMYTFGLFDSIRINWEYLIASLAILGITWVGFCICILLLTLLATIKWKKLELGCQDSFCIIN